MKEKTRKKINILLAFAIIIGLLSFLAWIYINTIPSSQNWDYNGDYGHSSPIEAYGKENIYTVEIINGSLNFTDSVDSWDRVIKEKEITFKIVFHNYNNSKQVIHLIPSVKDEGLYDYMDIKYTIGGVTYSLDKIDIYKEGYGCLPTSLEYFEKTEIPIPPNSNASFIVHIKLLRSPIGSVIDNFTYMCYLRVTCNWNYNVCYWDEAIPFEVKT